MAAVKLADVHCWLACKHSHPACSQSNPANLLYLLRHGAKGVDRGDDVVEELLHKGRHVGGVCGRQAQHVRHGDGRHHHRARPGLHALERHVQHLWGGVKQAGSVQF
jgi:hypothetical protein